MSEIEATLNLEMKAPHHIGQKVISYLSLVNQCEMFRKDYPKNK